MNWFRRWVSGHQHEWTETKKLQIIDIEIRRCPCGVGQIRAEGGEWMNERRLQACLRRRQT